GEPLAGRGLVGFRPPCGPAAGGLFPGAPVARPVAGHRAGDDPAGGGALAGAAQVAVRFQLPQGGGDAGGALGEAGGQRLDVDGGAPPHGLDVAGQPDGEQGQLLVLGQVVADHREVLGVPDVVVDDAGGPSAVGVPAGVLL